MGLASAHTRQSTVVHVVGRIHNSVRDLVKTIVKAMSLDVAIGNMSWQFMVSKELYSNEIPIKTPPT